MVHCTLALGHLQHNGNSISSKPTALTATALIQLQHQPAKGVKQGGRGRAAVSPLGYSALSTLGFMRNSSPLVLKGLTGDDLVVLRLQAREQQTGACVPADICNAE